MGNQHSYSDYNCNNSWRIESSNVQPSRCNKKNSRTHADLGGAISRLIGHSIANETRKAYKKALHHDHKSSSKNPRSLENLYGTDYVNYINPNQLQRSVSDNPPQFQPMQRNQPRTHSAISFSSNEVRRPDINLSSRVEDFQAICHYCNDTIVPEFYGYHLEQCKHNPQNVKKSCDYCGVLLSQNEIERHLQDCDAKIENLKIPCDYCKKEVSLAEYNYHRSSCNLNPKNVQSQPRKIKKDELYINQIQECAICLLEMKKDSHVRFLECAHKFHDTCIEDWSHKKKACPVCMTNFE